MGTGLYRRIGARTGFGGEVVLAAVIERRGNAVRQVAGARRGEREVVQLLGGSGAEVEHKREPACNGKTIATGEPQPRDTPLGRAAAEKDRKWPITPASG